MRAVVTYITVAAFGLHVLLGCCAHHAHSADKPPCAAAVAKGHPACGHGHSYGHEHSLPESETPQHPGESHDDCHESHCNLLATGKTTIVLDMPVAAMPAVAPGTTAEQVSSSASTWIRDTGDHLRLPVRLHLLHQVLLI